MFSWVRIAVIIGILAIISGGYLYLSNLNKTIQQLTSENSTLEFSLSSSEEAITKLQLDQARRDEQLQSLYSQLSTIRSQNKELSNKINNVDLTTIAKQKPDIVKNALNQTTADSNRCFELISGSPLNKREQDAKTAQEFNPECPWLFPAR